MRVTIPARIDQILINAGNAGLQAARLQDNRYVIFGNDEVVVVESHDLGVEIFASNDRLDAVEFAFSLAFPGEEAFFFCAGRTERGIGSILPLIHGVEDLTDNFGTYGEARVLIVKLMAGGHRDLCVFVSRCGLEEASEVFRLIQVEAGIVTGLV